MKLVVQNGDRDLIKCADRIEHLHYQEAFAVAQDPDDVSKSGHFIGQRRNANIVVKPFFLVV